MVSATGNVSIRDYNNDGNTNVIDNTSTIQVWDNGLGQRLDRQEYLLPPEFATQTLTSVTITDTGNEGSGTNGSRAVLAALTVSSCLAYVTETITASSGPIVYHPHLRLYMQDVSFEECWLDVRGWSPILHSAKSSCRRERGEPIRGYDGLPGTACQPGAPGGIFAGPQYFRGRSVGVQRSLRGRDLIHAFDGRQSGRHSLGKS